MAYQIQDNESAIIVNVETDEVKLILSKNPCDDIAPVASLTLAAIVELISEKNNDVFNDMICDKIDQIINKLDKEVH